MREIKYRAWHKKLKKMFQVDTLCITRTNHFITAMIYDLKLDAKVRVEYPFHLIELIQYTGLKDKNGREIYEGDIVAGALTGSWKPEYQYRNYYQILWNKYEWMYKDVGYSKSRLPNKPNYLHKEPMNIQYLGNDIEIIGSIYENPELSEIK